MDRQSIIKPLAIGALSLLVATTPKPSTALEKLETVKAAEVECISDERIKAVVRAVPEYLEPTREGRYLVAAPANVADGGRLEVYVSREGLILFRDDSSRELSERFMVHNFGSTEVGCASGAKLTHGSPYVVIEGPQAMFNMLFEETERALSRALNRRFN